jgi:glycosyltransferase involved in cell wall biosynthesis
MPPFLEITALVITHNEENNLARVLEGLRWLRRVVVLDSGSDDATQEICARFPNVDFMVRPFDSFASQCNYGLTHVDTPWCLSIDADYVIPRKTAEEMVRAVAGTQAVGFEAQLRYCIDGHPLRRAILPNRVVLFRTELARYEQDGHAHRLRVVGPVLGLTHPILHDDRKPFARWLASQDRYAAQEADKLARTSLSALSWPDRVRLARVVAPWLVPMYYLFLRGGLRDGWPGLNYAAQRTIAELVLSIKLIERAQSPERGHPR